MKNYLTIILILLIFMPVLSLTVAEVPMNGDGSLENPYEIANLENLRWLSENDTVWGDSLNIKYFEQVVDIDASDTYTWNDGAGFQPIGYTKSIAGSSELERKYFYGAYNGNNHKILNLYMNTSQTNYENTGIFGLIENASISNLIIEDATIGGNSVVGSLVGSGGNSIIEKCSISSLISGNELLGGLAGILANSHISQVSAYSILNAQVSGGGLVGLLNNSDLDNSHFTGQINIEENSANPLFGGLVLTLLNSSITNSYANLSSNSTFGGGLVGMGMNSSLDACLFNSDLYSSTSLIVTNINTSINSSSGLSASSLTNSQTYAELAWDFENIWSISAEVNDNFPYLQWTLNSTSLEDNGFTPITTNKLNIYPNPFNPTTTIEFILDKEEHGVLEIYNIRGQKVRTLNNGLLEAKKHKIVWNGVNDQGKKVASALYFARLRTASQEITSKLIIMK